MGLWWVEIWEKAPGQRKWRVNRYVVMAETGEDAASQARTESRVDFEPDVRVKVKVDEYPGTVVSVGTEVRS